MMEFLLLIAVLFLFLIALLIGEVAEQLRRICIKMDETLHP